MVKYQKKHEKVFLSERHLYLRQRTYLGTFE